MSRTVSAGQAAGPGGARDFSVCPARAVAKHMPFGACSSPCRGSRRAHRGRRAPAPARRGRRGQLPPRARRSRSTRSRRPDGFGNESSSRSRRSRRRRGPEREPGNTDRRARASGDGRAVRGQPAVDVDQAGARTDRGGAVVRMHVSQTRDVHDNALARRRVAGVGVPAAARHDPDRMLSCPPHRLLDVLRRLAVHNCPGVGAVEAAVDQHLVLSIRRARRSHDRPLELARQLTERTARLRRPVA